MRYDSIDTINRSSFTLRALARPVGASDGGADPWSARDAQDSPPFVNIFGGSLEGVRPFARSAVHCGNEKNRCPYAPGSARTVSGARRSGRSEEHTSELQSL